MTVHISRVIGAVPVTNFFVHFGTSVHIPLMATPMNLYRDVFSLPKHPSLQDKNRELNR